MTRGQVLCPSKSEASRARDVPVPEAYRPDSCPHCRLAGLWCHGCYYRKADRSAGVESHNPVAVLRFLCRSCLRTCSRLPLCIAPRRWYD
jgi:hypothetical protein